MRICVLSFISILMVSCAAQQSLPVAEPEDDGPKLPDRSTILTSSGNVIVGAEAPWFAAESSNDGRVINSRTFVSDPDRTTALVFFSTTCAPCRIGLRMIADSTQRLDEAGVTIILVSVAEEQSVVAPFIADMDLQNFTAVLDRYSVNGERFGIVVTKDDAQSMTLPRTFLIDGSGSVTGIVGEEGADYVDILCGGAQ